MRSRSYLYPFSLVFLAAACSGGGNETPSPAPAVGGTAVVTPREALASSEAAGSTPALDRSTSVVGPDSNSNGVRDDVERYIDRTAYTPAQKSSARQLSKAMTVAMGMVHTDEAARRNATTLMNDAVACVWKAFPADQADAAVTDMRKVTVNTKERYDAYMRYNAAVAGTVVKLPREPRCD